MPPTVRHNFFVIADTLQHLAFCAGAEWLVAMDVAKDVIRSSCDQVQPGNYFLRLAGEWYGIDIFSAYRLIFATPPKALFKVYFVPAHQPDFRRPRENKGMQTR